MNVYSHIIGEFIVYLEELSKEIISKEMGLKMSRRYFQHKRNHYPLKITVFEANSPLGEFVPNFYQININRYVMSWNEVEIKNLLRHELLHYICFIQFGDQIDSHGIEFRNMGSSFGYGKEITQAVWKIDKKESIQQEKKKNKVDKLLRLSKSSNIHEAQLALKKAKEMMSDFPLFGEESEVYYIKQIAQFKRSSTKVKIISHILDTFHLRSVTNYGTNFAYLEVTGQKPYIEYADYLYDYLDKQLEFLWKEAKNTTHLSGITDKNSFLWGFWDGYSKKIKKDPTQSQGIILREKELDSIVELFYRRVSKQKQKQRFSPLAHKKGVQSALGFNIKNPIKYNSKKEISYES